LSTPGCFYRAALLTLSSALLVGCTMAPVHQRPALPEVIKFQNAVLAGDTAEQISADWWKKFGSKELDALMAEALKSNLDLKMTFERIAQARAQARIAGAPLFPRLDADGTTTLSRAKASGATLGSTSKNYHGVLTSSYEVDLFGKNRSGLNAAEEGLRSVQYGSEVTRLAIQAEVASVYFQTLTLKDRTDIAQKNLAAARDILQLVETQYKLGAKSALELAQQRTAVAILESSLPVLEQQYLAARNALAVLLGRAPENLVLSGSTLADLHLPEISPDLPSKLLTRRPDILAAEANLRAAEANVGVARAKFLPSFNLTASAAISGIISGGSETLLSLTAGVVAPIFSGGQLEGQLNLAKARQRELVAAYVKTVLISLEETEDSLATVRTSKTNEESLATAARESTRAYELSMVRYRAGASDYFTLLDTQRTQLDAQDRLAQAQLSRFNAAISLFKALGGGWQENSE
jgi:multidrug efflux system outer membrane protein